MARVPVMHSSVGRVCLLLLVLLLLCLRSVPLVSAESQWIEIKSPHFSVITDAGERRGREVAIRFEQMRAVFGTLMVKGNVNLAVPLQIVAFRNGKELRQVVPLWHGKPIQVAGLFQGGEDRAFIMLDMSVENPWTVVFHEYAHQLMNGNVSAPIDPATSLGVCPSARIALAAVSAAFQSRNSSAHFTTFTGRHAVAAVLLVGFLKLVKRLVGPVFLHPLNGVLVGLLGFIVTRACGIVLGS